MSEDELAAHHQLNQMQQIVYRHSGFSFGTKNSNDNLDNVRAWYLSCGEGSRSYLYVLLTVNEVLEEHINKLGSCHRVAGVFLLLRMKKTRAMYRHAYKRPQYLKDVA